MTERKRQRGDVIESEFDEALARLLQTDPAELAASVAADTIKMREQVQRRVAAARKEIEDGARPKRGRFRL
jgi:hypothetical protein